MSCSSAASISPARGAICCSEVPSGSLPALLATSAVLALQRLVLPAVHWLDDTRPFGILRPRRGNGSGRMTPGVIADSIVNLCGAIGLAVAMLTLYRRDPRSPLTRRLLVAARHHRVAVPDARHGVVERQRRGSTICR